MYGDNKPNEADAQKYNGDILFFQPRLLPYFVRYECFDRHFNRYGIMQYNYRNTRANFCHPRLLPTSEGKQNKPAILEAIAKMQGDSNAR